MPTQPYYVDGERVPSVTQILARWKESGGLIHWSWKQGKAGLDYRAVRDKAADAGTMAHEMVECDIRGKTFAIAGRDPEVLKKADHAFLGYLEWKANSAVQIERSEVPLVSRNHFFGGCLDAVRVRESRRLIDWKTSNAIYTDMLIQVAGGYSILWEENFPDEPIEGIEILRFSKPEEPDDPISFHHHFWSAGILPIAQKQFLLLKEAFVLDQRLRKLL